MASDDFFCLPPVKKGKVNVEVELFLKDRLCALHPRAISNAEIRSMVENSPTNYIVYRAKQTTGPSTWYGLELETCSVGSFNFDERVVEAKAVLEHMENRRRRLSSVRGSRSDMVV